MSLTIFRGCFFFVSVFFVSFSFSVFFPAFGHYGRHHTPFGCSSTPVCFGEKGGGEGGFLHFFFCSSGGTRVKNDPIQLSSGSSSSAWFVSTN